MRTIIYIDGFNLYYGCLKKTPYRWLDLNALFTNILDSQNKITKIRYFTARVKPTPKDPYAPNRQDVYLRALKKHTPKLDVKYGHFLRHNVRRALSAPPHNTVEIIKTEEKGSDVNLAVALLNDAWLNEFDCAVVVTNDSDMQEAMKLVKEHHPSKILGLITPGQHQRTSEELKQYADFVRKIRKSVLKISQLPEKVGNITKPTEWQ